MLVCDVSAIDRLLDFYWENLSVFYKGEEFNLYDLRDEFVEKNMNCSLDNYIVTSEGIKNIDGQMIVSVNPVQRKLRDDLPDL